MKERREAELQALASRKLGPRRRRRAAGKAA